MRFEVHQGLGDLEFFSRFGAFETSDGRIVFFGEHFEGIFHEPSNSIDALRLESHPRIPMFSSSQQRRNLTGSVKMSVVCVSRGRELGGRTVPATWGGDSREYPLWAVSVPFCVGSPFFVML